MTISLAGRRVLHIAPRFFGYEIALREELARRGAEVDYLPDRPFSSPMLKAMTRFKRDWTLHVTDRLYRRQLTAWGRREYDIVFVVNGQTLSRDVLAQLRREFPRARFILYMWDSIENRRCTLESLEFFDDLFSFDRRDVETYGFRFRPLFFSRGFDPSALHIAYDISFIGTMHTDRYRVVSSVDRSLGVKASRYWYLYLQAPWVYYAYKVLNPAFRDASRKEFRFQPLAKDKVQEVFRTSRAILDVEHPRQVGLTIRTLEVLGASKKLVTTNPDIVTYDFYRPENILVIDRDKAAVPLDFIKSDYVPVDPAIYARYSIQGWMDEILSVLARSGSR